MIWKYLDSFETVWKIKDYLKKKLQFWNYLEIWNNLEKIGQFWNRPKNFK